MQKLRTRKSKILSQSAFKSAVAGHVLADGQESFPVVGIGASAGGLEACKNLVGGLPPDTGMAFILIQHLDPTHESMMVNLLAGHTSLTVQQATDNMPVEIEHLYVIPPGTYLSVEDGVLRLSQPQARHGARLPYDFLLHSLAKAYGRRAVCVILSGTGGDGSLGLKAVKENSGFVIAQDPDEAGYDGMPRSAIMTGSVDLVLPIAKIPEALMKYGRRLASGSASATLSSPAKKDDWLSEIVVLLRTKAAHDFTLYKPGTLQRRIERRMAMVDINADDKDRYIEMLNSDAGELELLAKDLLINVTGFFRDSHVFDFLTEKTIPDLIRNQPADQPLRIWVAGCSTGEEAYSLAMVVFEQIEALKIKVKLQVFASDVDPDAVMSARDGLYPETIKASVSPARLIRFFSREDHGYRVSQELRTSVVFTVQDLLADPPFSRLDMISCRNLLIYLSAEAQARVISLFHFALRDGGILLLGTSETAGAASGRFQTISKPERLYRHIGRSRPGEVNFATSDGVRVPVRQGQSQGPSRHASLGELCRRAVMENYAPAAVLTNPKHECLYSLGPVDRYLRVAQGHSTNNLLAMVRYGMSARLSQAILKASHEKTSVVVEGGEITNNGKVASFSIKVLPVPCDDEELLLVCFIDMPKREVRGEAPVAPEDLSRVSELERELEDTKNELRISIRNLEISSEEQKSINEEALSVNEEYQSSNEELLASKEELQSLNEELTALNNQLQETLERQRTLSGDLQNVLYSTDVATLFLDAGLHIRFFTPATKSLFNVIPSDVGRPLADLHSLAADDLLPNDARSVLQTRTFVEREIEGQGGIWYSRRISPYRSKYDKDEGIVITFTDITERRRIAEALNFAKRQADLANEAKSRFLAAASHDLRQPLQTLTLIQELLARQVDSVEGRKLVVRLDETLSAMSVILNTLLDINQIETGNVQADLTDFPINDLLLKLGEEFAYIAQNQGLELHVLPCRLHIRSDRRLLEPMLRNLLSNALKYTKEGRVLLGCRRRARTLSIEVWDTGIGIPEKELQTIFLEYHQIDNQARERSLGLGLGLSIVQRLGNLLGHRVHVHSRMGKGSMFAIEAMISPDGAGTDHENARRGSEDGIGDVVHRTAEILIVEDDSDLRELLEILLKDCGHRTTVARDGVETLELMKREGFHSPDLILTDLQLPNGLNGLQIGEKLRKMLRPDIPVIVLTGDTSAETLRDIARYGCVHLSKPVKVKEVTRVIQLLLANPKAGANMAALPPAQAATDDRRPSIAIIDDDQHIRQTLRIVLEDHGLSVQDYGSSEAFLDVYQPGREGCLLVDACLPGMSGFELLQHLREAGQSPPAIMITGYSDVPMAIQAMKAGALDYIEKPVASSALLASIERALELSQDSSKLSAWRENAASQIAKLTPRERQVMELVLAGHPSKNIAVDLGISQRTVENHRASIMAKTDSKSLPALARLALAATPLPKTNR